MTPEDLYMSTVSMQKDTTAILVINHALVLLGTYLAYPSSISFLTFQYKKMVGM